MKPQFISALAKALSSLVESDAEKVLTLIEQVKAAGYIVATKDELAKELRGMIEEKPELLAEMIKAAAYVTGTRN